MGRKIAIVGAGAVGGYAGAHMVQAGEDVTFIDPWPEHVEHMRKHGLRVTHAKDVAEFSVPVRALHVTDAQQLAKEAAVDIAFVCMKSYDTAWAIFVNGCYWHHHTGCLRATIPARNRDFWTTKFAANRRRDARKIRALRARGFRIVVVWECQTRDAAALAARLSRLRACPAGRPRLLVVRPRRL